jgi:hypothetical protein
MRPLQFVTRERMLQAQQLIRETSRSLIEIRKQGAIEQPADLTQTKARAWYRKTPSEQS